ncbi:putative reverse transcriptase [Nephila pilipes]|uniref:Putative reverse transcriptase n=1 Tax=Nephila pilipes TaxID=299642 RepID=A0A8X6PTF3_NEPPI|nr:putative reverse transcriptase [Nephila pilipes]
MAQFGRTKSRASFKKLRSTSVITKTTDIPSTSTRSEIENTFRERFPDLPVFNQSSSSSENSSPDQDFLLSWLKAPPTGPPTITSFPKREYSLVVKKGLFRCEFCEKAFISKQGIDSHYDSAHGVKKKRITAKLFPQGRQDICHFCCHSPQGSQTLADHYRLIHNLEVHSDCTASSTTITISPSNFVSNQPKQRNVSQDFSSITITPSSNEQFDTTAITTNAEIHPMPDASSEDSSSRICSECGFVAHKMSGLKLHYFKVHHIKKFPKRKTSPSDPEVIEILPNSSDLLNRDPNIIEKPVIHVLPSDQNASVEDKPSDKPEFFNKIKKHVTFEQQKKIFYNQSHHSSSQSDFQPDYREFYNSKFQNKNSATSHTNSNFDSTEDSNPLSTSDRHDHPQYPYVSFQNNILKLGQQNHLASHKREQIRKDATPLIIPESNASKKIKKKRKIESLSHGIPDDTRIAPSLTSINQDRTQNKYDDVSSLDGEDEDCGPKIDLPHPSVLSSFLDPLDALIEVDDLADALTSFENLISGIVEAVQEHFHLPLQRASNNKGENKKQFDPMNAQEVQKLYKWNRRRCVRNIACPNTNRCSISKDILQNYFTMTWGAPNEEFMLEASVTKERPIVLDSLDPEFVLCCLQTCENSAPGLDQITYRQWREVDPRCLVLSKIFNICLYSDLSTLVFQITSFDFLYCLSSDTISLCSF